MTFPPFGGIISPQGIKPEKGGIFMAISKASRAAYKANATRKANAAKRSAAARKANRNR